MATVKARHHAPRGKAHSNRRLARALDTVTSTIAMLLRIRMVPGNAWSHRYKTRTCVYPIHELISLDATIAAMKLWQAAAHVSFTHGALSEYDVLVDTVLEIEDRTGLRTTHPSWLMPILAVTEQERVANLARLHGRSLAQKQLPPRGTSFRRNDREVDLKAIAIDVAAETAFWDVATAAVRGLVSNTLEIGDLHHIGLMWPDERVARLHQAVAASSYDALIESLQPIIVEIAIERAASIAESTPGAPPDDAEENPDDPKSSPSTDEEISREDADGTAPRDEAGGEPSGSAHPKDESESEGETIPKSSEDNASEPASGISATAEADFEDSDADTSGGLVFGNGVRVRIAGEIDASGSQPVSIDFTVDAGKLIVKKNDETIAEIDLSDLLIALEAPDVLWEAVSRTNQVIAAPVRRVIDEFLTENEIGEIERGTRSGKIDIRQIARPTFATSTPPFRRRLDPEDCSYDVALVVDHSGSMSSATGSPEDPCAFGTQIGARWHLATRLLVALCETLQHLPGTRTAVVAYNDTIDIGKGFGDTLSDEVKDAIISNVAPCGGNEDTLALQTAISLFAQSHAERKLLIYLTDGEFCSDERAMQHVVAKTRASGIEFVVLTVGQPATNVRKFVGEAFADEITEATTASVLSRHLNRMVAAA